MAVAGFPDLLNRFEPEELLLVEPWQIDTKPPHIQIESGLTYVKRAGSAAVTYRLDGPARAGR